MGAETSEWVKVAGPGEVPRGQAARFEVEGRDVAVFHLEDGSIRAVADACPHAGFSLHDSEVSGHQVTCGLHHWVFSLDDGSCLFGARAVASYPCELRGDGIYVSPPRQDPGKMDKAVKALRVCVAAGVSAKLPRLIDRALELEVEPVRILQLAEDASPAQLRPAQQALAQALAAFPGIPRGDILLAAVRWAAESAVSTDPPAAYPPPPELPPPAGELPGEPGRHFRRRLVAALEKRDAIGACIIVREYIGARHNPVYLAQDLIRSALESEPWLFPHALGTCLNAYHWSGDELHDVHQVVTALCAAGERADSRRRSAQADDGPAG